jgi:hypothetical protein
MQDDRYLEIEHLHGSEGAKLGGIGLGSLFLGTSALNADDSKPHANPPARMIFETVFTEGVEGFSYFKP